jgi:hypothetical protein
VSVSKPPCFPLPERRGEFFDLTNFYNVIKLEKKEMKQRKWKSIADKLHDEWCIENGYPIKIKQPRSRSKDEPQRTDDTQEDGSGKDSDA